MNKFLIDLSVCAPAKYGETSVKASHDQPYVHMIKYFITNIIFFERKLAFSLLSR